MEILFEQSRHLIGRVAMGYVRDISRIIDWNDRLILIRGPRGVGKSTLLLQRMKQAHGLSGEALYITLDDFYFTTNRLADVARSFAQLGGKVLYIDEVHRYPQASWATEIKNVYDLMPELKMVVTGSSIIGLHHRQADLSRRAVAYDMAGLTFREYLALTTGESLPAFGLADVLQHPGQAADVIIRDHAIRPLASLQAYMSGGYYPFFTEGPQTYRIRLREVIRTVIESDFNYLPEHTITDHARISRLLYVMAGSVPFKPNVSKLSERIGLNRNRLVQYLYLLERARLLNLLHADRDGITLLQKPDKIYFENTNLMYAISPDGVDRGNVRETFVLSHLLIGLQAMRRDDVVVRYPDKGDFRVDGLPGGPFLLEVGGAGKSRAQIRDAERGWVIRDDIEYGSEGVVPLWLLGFI